MQRKQFWTICKGIDRPESPEDYRPTIPSRHIFSHNLSKSAPCLCCGTGCQYCITIKDSCGNKIENATVKLTSGANNYSNTTNSVGHTCVNVPSTGSYTREISACGYTTQTTTVTVTCPTTNATDVTLVSDCSYVCTPVAKSQDYSFNVVNPYSIPIPNVTITVSGAGGGTVTTNTSGNATIKLLAGCNFTYSISKTSLQTTTGSVTASCSPALIQPTTTAASGHGFTPCCGDASPFTLYLTDAGGTHPLAYDSGVWNGCYQESPDHGVDCTTGGICHDHTDRVYEDCGIAVQWELRCVGSGGIGWELRQMWTTCDGVNLACGDCTGGAGASIQVTHQCDFSGGIIGEIAQEYVDLSLSAACPDGAPSSTFTFSGGAHLGSAAVSI